jgi:hypothetical protein
MKRLLAKWVKSGKFFGEDRISKTRNGSKIEPLLKLKNDTDFK